MPLSLAIGCAPFILLGAAALLSSIAMSSPASAQAAQRGAGIARVYCMKCHSIDKVSPSAMSIAPPFREIGRKYPAEHLGEALAEGIVTGHPTMPEFRFDADQIADFLAFLKTLNSHTQ